MHSHLDDTPRRPCLSASNPSLSTVSCLVSVGFALPCDLVRIAHFSLCLMYGYNTYTIGVLPIYNYGSFGPFILDITSNVVFFLTMLMYVNLTLHSINVVPFIGVMNEKVDISRRWLIVLAASTVVCLSLIAVYELRLLSLQWFVFISSVLFSIMEAFIIVYWVRFYRILCVIIQKTTIPVELKRRQVSRLFLRLCVFVGSQGIRIVLQLLCSFYTVFTLESLISVAAYLVITEVVPGVVALVEQYKTIATSER
ncbi:hypothetical protein WA538_000408 [Blastocystis sp. DL]